MTVNLGTTLYIGSMYEEEVSNPAHPYTVYYFFGGKPVAMRKASYSSGGGVFRIVGDHLGSTSLIVDTSTPPQVVQRSYYKPYGEVAWSWSLSGGGGPTSLTSIGYTGQRLDADSGLMLLWCSLL